MRWLSLLRFTLIFGVSFIAIPAWLLGRVRDRPWRLAAAEAFVLTSFAIQMGITALGFVRLSLPGAGTLLYLGVLAGLSYPRLRHLLGDCRSAGELGLRLLDSAERWPERRRSYRRVAGRLMQAAPFCALAAAILITAGVFPVHNFRFLNLESYGRALSLAVVSSGEKWRPDLSVPLLFLPMVWSSLSSTAAVALSRPVFLALFAGAAGFTAFERTGSRMASLLATGLGGLGALWLSGILSQPSAEMAASFVLLGFALWRRSRAVACLPVLTGVSISAAPQVWLWAAAGVAASGFGALLSQAALTLPPRFRLSAGRVTAGMLLTAICGWPRPPIPDGPYQYEAAAHACEWIARARPRNTWLIVSPSQELSATYGQGWHAEMSEFVSRFSPAQLRDPAFRLPFPVAQIFFFVEKRPLWPSLDRERLRSARIDQVFDPVAAAYNSPLERATLQFQAAELLAAYAESHSDLAVVYADDSLTIYRAAGTIGAGSVRHTD